MSASCRECGAPVEFVRTARGKFMPLDPEPVARRTVVVGEPGNAVVRDGVVHVLGPGKSIGPGEQMRVPHFASCPGYRHGARGRETAVDHAHERLAREAEQAAERDTARAARQAANALRTEAARLRNCATALDRLADAVEAL